MSNVLLKKIFPQDFSNYINSINNASFSNSSLILPSNSSLIFNFQSLNLINCIIKFRRSSGNGIVTVVSNNKTKECQINSKVGQGVPCEVGEDGVVIIKRSIRSKGDLLIDEILLYTESTFSVKINKEPLKNKDMIESIIYDSDKEGFNNANNHYTINDNGLILNNIGSYCLDLPKLKKDKNYFITINVKRLDGNGKFVYGVVPIKSNYDVQLASLTTKSYTFNIKSDIDNQIFKFVISRPSAAKGNIAISRLIVSSEEIDLTEEVLDAIDSEVNTTFDKVVFFNFWHNGDIHVSRSFIKYIKNLGYNCEYWHNNDPGLLKDLDIKSSKIPNVGINKSTPTHIRNNVLYINTWYLANPVIFDKYNVNFDCLYEYFKGIILKYFNIDISNENIWDFFPEIDYSNCDIVNAKFFLNNHKDKKKILISNGDFYSGQTFNFNFGPIINSLTKKYSDFIFLISNYKEDIVKRDNVFFTENIIKTKGCDLNENSYLSSECDIIVGRSSGAYTFAMTNYNYQRDCKFIVFIRNEHMAYDWIKDLKMDYKAKVIGSNTTYIKDIYEILNTELNKV